MNEIMLLAVLYVLSTTTLILFSVPARRKYAILTYEYVMRLLAAIVYSVANVSAGIIIFRHFIVVWGFYLFDTWSAFIRNVGYLRFAFWVSVSMLITSYLFLIERRIVSRVIRLIWRYSGRSDIVRSIQVLEEEKNEYSPDSEWYMETVCKLSFLYQCLISRAHKRGETGIASEYEQRADKLKKENREIVIKAG